MSESGKLDRHIISQVLIVYLVLFPIISIGLGCALTPEKEHDEFMGGLIPLCIYGLTGALAGALSTAETVWVFESSRFRSWTVLPRVLLAILICVLTCVGGFLCGLVYFMGRQPVSS